MTTKTIITAIILLFSITSFAQKMEYKTTMDLEDGEKISDIYTIDLKAKTLKIKFENEKKVDYKIEKYEIEKNQEDEDVYGEGKGVKFTKYHIRLEKKTQDPLELLRTISYVTLMIPEKQYSAKFRKIIEIKYYGMMSSFYYAVIEN